METAVDSGWINRIGVYSRHSDTKEFKRTILIIQKHLHGIPDESMMFPPSSSRWTIYIYPFCPCKEPYRIHENIHEPTSTCWPKPWFLSGKLQAHARAACGEASGGGGGGERSDILGRGRWLSLSNNEWWGCNERNMLKLACNWLILHVSDSALDDVLSWKIIPDSGKTG